LDQIILDAVGPELQVVKVSLEERGIAWHPDRHARSAAVRVGRRTIRLVWSSSGQREGGGGAAL
jgi:hypothetical protein